jgi:hypothetical protein
LASLLGAAFARVDEAVEYFEKFLSADVAPTGRVCAAVTMKGRNLALGCYSLALDGLAQESGAILRPLLESIELLEYLRDIPGAVDQALTGTLPKAGKRARLIGSRFQELRDHLSNNASHLEFGPESMGHLLDLSAGTFRPVQRFRQEVLEQNMATLFTFTGILGREAAICFRWSAAETAPASADSLLNKALRCLETGEPVVKRITAKRTAQPARLLSISLPQPNFQCALDC